MLPVVQICVVIDRVADPRFAHRLDIVQAQALSPVNFFERVRRFFFHEQAGLIVREELAMPSETAPTTPPTRALPFEWARGSPASRRRPKPSFGITLCTASAHDESRNSQQHPHFLHSLSTNMSSYNTIYHKSNSKKRMKFLKARLKRAKKRFAILQNEIIEGGRWQEEAHNAELLQSNLYRIKKGDARD